MTQAINAFKAEARRLHKHLTTIFPSATYSQALEAVAALHGAADWRTLQASAPQTADPCQCGPITPLIEELAAKYGKGDVWGQHPRFPRADWALEATNGDTWQSYWIWLMSKLEDEPRYFSSEGWSHIFGPTPRREDTVRWVFDREEHRIVFMQIHLNIGNTWVAASAEEIADVDDSLKNANDELFDDPEHWDVETSNEYPDWAIPA